MGNPVQYPNHFTELYAAFPSGTNVKFHVPTLDGVKFHTYNSPIPKKTQAETDTDPTGADRGNEMGERTC